MARLNINGTVREVDVDRGRFKSLAAVGRVLLYCHWTDALQGSTIASDTSIMVMR